MGRIDTSEFLVHFTKGDNALDSFRSIATSSELRGGTGFIKGGYRCVCFTEAPLHALQDILLHPSEHGYKYAPFGIVVRKAWLFQYGGRPVIYQPDAEYGLLPEALRWRHVRYEPNANPPIDFSWEREWRVLTDSLKIAPDNAWLVVPSVEKLREVCEEHHLAESVPLELLDRLEDIMVLDAVINGRTWTAILLSNPSCGWSGLDVDLD